MTTNGKTSKGGRGKGKPFDSERARKAAEASARKRREQRELREQESASAAPRSEGSAPQSGMAASGVVARTLRPGEVGVMVPVDVAGVIRALVRAATAGDAQAAGTLLRWTVQYPEVDPSVQLDSLPAVVRQRLLARLVQELGAEEDGSASLDQDSAVPSTARGTGEGEATPAEAAESRDSKAGAPQQHTPPQKESAPGA